MFGEVGPLPAAPGCATLALLVRGLAIPGMAEVGRDRFGFAPLFFRHTRRQQYAPAGKNHGPLCGPRHRGAVRDLSVQHRRRYLRGPRSGGCRSGGGEHRGALHHLRGGSGGHVPHGRGHGGGHRHGPGGPDGGQPRLPDRPDLDRASLPPPHGGGDGPGPPGGGPQRRGGAQPRHGGDGGGLPLLLHRLFRPPAAEQLPGHLRAQRRGPHPVLCGDVRRGGGQHLSGLAVHLPFAVGDRGGGGGLGAGAGAVLCHPPVPLFAPPGGHSG